MVKWPMPGRTRFLRMEVAVAEAERTRMREDSSAAWPVAAHNLPPPGSVQWLSASATDGEAGAHAPQLTIIASRFVVRLGPVD